jgi:hypothetical protein
MVSTNIIRSAANSILQRINGEDPNAAPVLYVGLFKQIPQSVKHSIEDGTTSLTEVQVSHEFIIENELPKSIGILHIYEHEDTIYFGISANHLVYENLNGTIGGFFVHNGNEVIYAKFEDYLLDGSDFTIQFNSIGTRPYLFELETGH